jgi:hypothetical protein
MEADEDTLRRLKALREFQHLHRLEVVDVSQSPALALKTLNDAVDQAPKEYRGYLVEAVACYENALYRAAILMVWAACVEHLYMTASAHPNGVKDFEKANFARFGGSRNYREIKKKDDFLYLGEKNWLQLAEDAGMMNKNAKLLLEERLVVRNRCGHPTQYVPGREEAVVFIESLMLNILSGQMLNW